MDKNKDPILWQNEWMKVFSRDGWYTYAHHGNGKGVAVLGYSVEPFMILGRYENTPPHDDGISLCSLTGMLDKENEEPTEAAIRELNEESGYVKEVNDLLSLGTIRQSKGTDTLMYLFAVELMFDKENHFGEGDGTKGEEGSYAKFITAKEAIECKDPLLGLMISRLLLKKNYFIK